MTLSETAPPKVVYDDYCVKIMLYPAIIFMVIGMTFGLFISFNTFVFPDYFAGEYIHFGRVRPVHVGGVTLLWLLSANVALMYFFVQRLCGIKIWNGKLAVWSAFFWWTALIIGVFSYPFGTNYGWEYAELPNWVGWVPVKALFTIAWLAVATNLLLTIYYRRFEKMYVSLWYTAGTVMWTTVAYIVGSYALEYLPGGISRVNASFFYVHNLVGLIFTPMGLATLYYFLPKIANTPIYSHKLSMIGFWSLAFIYSWIGAHHMIHGPISQWLQTTSIVFSMWLFIPVWTVITNIFATIKDHWKTYIQSVPIRFLIMGNLFYLITCIQGPLMALRNVNEVTSKTDWVIGHAHVSLFATFTFFAIGGIYYVIPAITKKPLWSEALAQWHFSLSMIGSMFFILPLWLGGFLQGLQWANWASGTSYAMFHNNLSHHSFIETITTMYPWWVMRSIGGSIIVIANIIFAFNIFNTILLKPHEPQESKVIPATEGQAA